MLIPPTITINGTSAERLLEQVNDVREKLQAALDAMTAAAPNARDYPSAFYQAFDAYRTETQAVTAVLRHFDRLAEQIVDAM